MANDYATLAEVKAALVDSGIGDTPAYDSILAALITRASRLIDTETKRHPGAYAITSSDEETRYYTGSGKSEQWIDEIAAAPSYVGVSEGGGVQSTDYTEYSSSDFFLWPYNAAYQGKPYRKLEIDTINGAYTTFYRWPRSVKITAPFGYSTTDKTPDEITQAVIIQVTRWYKRGQQGYADASVTPDLGSLRYVKRLDPDVAEIIEHFKRMTV